MENASKICKCCHVSKNLVEYGKDLSRKDGISIYCKTCIRLKSSDYRSQNREKTNLNQRMLYHKIHPDIRKCKKRRYNLVKFNLTPESYNELLLKQDGLCAICKGPPNGKWKNFHVDHCHDTGKVRGLLCVNCNTAIGKFNDSIEMLQVAIDYLKG